VANREIVYEQDDGGVLRGKLSITAEIVGDDGSRFDRSAEIDLRAHDEAEAGSPTMFQVFTLTMPGVTAATGRFQCVILDQNRTRPGLLNLVKENRARSELAGDWYAEVPRLDADGLLLRPPVFLARAPHLPALEEGRPLGEPETSPIAGYIHPIRRYGIENETLQVYFEVEPVGASRAEAAQEELFLQILAKDLDFALRDTLRLDLSREELLAGGGVAGVLYELDVNQLPPGVYQLSCMPLDGSGNSWVAEFDVFWSLSSLNRQADEMRGEGLTVLTGDRLQAFKDASQSEREAILADFWAELDPDPATSFNEVRMEFLSRVSYVRTYLGGFGRQGALDDRGQTFLLLGAPDEIQQQVLPANPKDQEDAVTRVYDGYAPVREGAWAKGEDAIRMSSVHQARREIDARRGGVGRDKGFELWIYNDKGQELFPNVYSGRQRGLRFLFVDRLGYGRFILQTTNAWDIGSVED